MKWTTATAPLTSMLLAAFATSVASAQAPDPASVEVPNLHSSSDQKVQQQGWKHFFFYKGGVSYNHAYSDFADCYRFLKGPSPVGPQLLPKSGARSRLPADGNKPSGAQNYGLVGGAIEQIVIGPMQRRLPQSRLRRCMEPRGYVRYAIDETTWNMLVDNYSQRSIAIQAKVASGRLPEGREVTE